MSYSKTIWYDSPSTATPITAANLNKIENGIENLDLSLQIQSGTFTPKLTLIDKDGNPGSVSYVFQEGQDSGYQMGNYYKIGKICYVSVHFKAYITSYQSGNCYMRMGDLPFTPATDYSFANMESHGPITDWGYGDLLWNGYSAEVKVRLQTGSGGAQSQLSGTGWIWLGFSGAYLIN